MHAYIYQISRHKLQLDEYINENTLLNQIGEGTNIDYVGEVNAEEYNRAIIHLTEKVFPDKLFTRIGKTTFRYNGNLSEYFEKWKEELRLLCDSLSPNNFPRTIRMIKEQSQCPFGSFDQFYNSEMGYLMLSSDFLIDFVQTLKHGENVHIGGILNFHYSPIL